MLEEKRRRDLRGTQEDESEEQPTTAELLESTHHLENNDFFDKIVKKTRTERVAVARKYPSRVKIVLKPSGLSKLKPPSRSDGSKRIAAHSVIRQRCDIEDLVKQKPQSTFDIIVAHNEAASEFSEAEERYNGVNRDLEDAQYDVDGSTTRLNYLYNQRKKTEEEKEENEAKVAAIRTDKVTCDEAYSTAKSKLEKIAPKMSEAQKESTSSKGGGRKSRINFLSLAGLNLNVNFVDLL